MLDAIRRQLIHNHSTTNLNLIGLMPEGDCSACDYARPTWVHAPSRPSIAGV